jgi:uncharacterized protein (TIGR02453 family)
MPVSLLFAPAPRTLITMPAHFTPDLFRFLTRLKRNNNREWFLKHKDEYQACALQPAIQFIADFAAPLYEISPYLVADPRTTRGSLFRIYRDTRFSSDKKPYKTHLAMRFSHRGKDVHSPGFYLHLEPGGCFAASGLWHPEPPVLLKVRNAIVERCDEWRPIRKKLNWDDASKLSRPPRGFPCDHEFVDDLKLRDLGTAIDFTDAQVCSPKFISTFAASCKKMSPIARFLSAAVGLPF